MPASQQADELTVPLKLLADCEGRKADPVQIESCGQGQVSARWQDGPVPQFVTHDAPEVQPGFPALPPEFGENPPELLGTIAQAMQTAETDPTRFALNTVQFRGRSGVLAGTDGRQLLIQSGFVFPWDGDVLVPKTPLFACKELPQDQPLLMGKLEDWLCVRIGPWTIWLAIDKAGRFPEVEDHLRQTDAASATLRIADEDAEFLLQSLHRLPSDGDAQAITVDLNGRVAIRAKPADRGKATELVLSRSAYSGEPICINTDRRYLSRALALGFREMHLFGREIPVQCQDPHRQYVWALIDPESAVPESKNAIRIESAQRFGKTAHDNPQTLIEGGPPCLHVTERAATATTACPHRNRLSGDTNSRQIQAPRTSSSRPRPCGSRCGSLWSRRRS